MTLVNNFITDLLDQVATKEGDKLLLEAGSRPRANINGTLETVPGSDIIELDELLYDLEALGVTGISPDDETGDFSFRFQPENETRAVRFLLSYYTDRGRFHVDITKGHHPKDILTNLIDSMEADKASDLIITGGDVPHYRMDGAYLPVPGFGPISVGEVLAELHDIGIDLADGKPRDFAYRGPVGASGESNRFRVNAEFKNGRVSAVFRMIPHEIKPLVW